MRRDIARDMKCRAHLISKTQAHLALPTIMEQKPKPQRSRKGKKAWRKNVDVNEINAALESKRDKEVLHGPDGEADFVIDTTGAPTKSTVKVLTASEILTNKSKVPALQTRVTKKKLSKARTSQLMSLAGRLLTVSKTKANIDREGIIRGGNSDIWGEPAPEVNSLPASISRTPGTRVPHTLREKPLHLETETSVNDDEFVHAGKSYNPSIESWQELIQREFGAETTLEEKRQAIEENQRRVQELINTLEDDELAEPKGDDEEPEEEKEEDKYKISVNAKSEWNKKTRTQRNKEARHKQMVDLGKKLRELKEQLKDINRLDEITEQVESKEPKKAGPKKYTSHGGGELSFKPIEVKLSDELTNNLRQVVPEGNLLYEQMYKLQMAGKTTGFSTRRKHTRRFEPKLKQKDHYRNFK